MSDTGRPHLKDYEMAVICALPIEFDAVEALFDVDWEEHEKYRTAPNDPNAYSMGRIANHNIVLAIMRGIGKATSASVAASFRQSFPNIKLGMVVGICGGVPFFGAEGRTEVLLGDIIISTGVIECDIGRQYSDKFMRKKDTLLDVLGRPNEKIGTFLTKMQTLKSQTRLEKNTSAHITDLLQQKGFKTSGYPGADQDILFESTYRHKHHGSTDCICARCEDKEDSVCDIALDSPCATLGCDANKQVLRDRLKKPRESSANQSITTVETGAETPSLCVHFGLVASGDSVIKSGYLRDELASQERVLAFEMEGAGVWDRFPTVVIKGVSDYADSHKNNQWQKYAAASAAACMKAFLKEWRPSDKVYQPEAGSRVSGLTEEQTSESRGATRLEFEAQSELESRSKIGKEVDKAYSLLIRREKKTMKQDLEVALQILLQARDGSRNMDSSLLGRIYWGLMVAEKELSCYRGFVNQEKLKHVKEAEKHSIEMAKVASRSSDAGLRVVVALEQSILKGREAELKFKEGADTDKTNRSRMDAVNGINKALKELQTIDPVRFEDNVDAALSWRDSSSKPLL